MADEIIIVGGGFAGLTAAVALAAVGRKVRVLEQKPYLGGRARSFVEPATGCVVDNGQHILMGCYHATRHFLGVIATLDRVQFQPRLSVKFLDQSGRLSSLSSADLPAPWHLLAGVLRSDSFSLQQKFEIARLGRALSSSVDSAKGSERSDGSVRSDGISQMSVEQWLTQLGQSEGLRRNFWDLLCIAAMNEDPRIASAALFRRVLDLALFSSPSDSGIGLPRYGLSHCYTEAARAFITLRGGQVELNRTVTGFTLSGGKDGSPTALAAPSRCEGVRLADGTTIAATNVLSTVPWFELARLLPEEALSSGPFFAGVLSLRPAPIISINLWFDRAITDLEFVGLRGTTVQWLFNKARIFSQGNVASDAGLRTPGCGPVSLVLSGAHAHIGRSKDDLVAMSLAELRQLLPAAREATLLHSLVIKERFATFSPNVDAEAVRPPARTPVQGLYLAGDWTATGLPATIEGAVKSGYTAAEEILQG